jgi:hypothetical protein
MALALTIELLAHTPASHRAVSTLRALHAAVPADIRVTPTIRYQGRSDVLVLWGPGAPDRFDPMAAQLAKGGHILALDLAYWQRDTKFRVAIDAAHPQRWVMRRDWPASRLTADRVTTSDRWNPTGPVIVAGLGRKARVQYGEHVVDAWERDLMAQAAARWPGRQVLYRKKQTDAPSPAGALLASTRPIDEVLAGASLVITWHSNVAVDAIRAGIPVICQDGAAAAVCPSTLGQTDPAPLAAAVRDRFLGNLAWFQWAPAEASAFWRWVPEVLA